MSQPSYIPRHRLRSRRTPVQARWASGNTFLSVRPEQLTLFDKQVERLGLTDKPMEWPYSEPLRKFAKTHRTQKYIPEYLLLGWGLELNQCDMDKVA